VQTYAAELRITNAKANLVDPGAMATRLRAKAFPGEAAGKVPDPAGLAPAIVDLLSAECELNGERLAL
jgi:hypothetical protein